MEHSMESKHAKCTGCDCDAGACNCGACSMINKLPPKMAFWAGVVVTAGCGFALGFIILLIMMFKGVNVGTFSTSTNSARANTNTNTAAAAANSNTAAKPAGKIDPNSLQYVQGSGEYTLVEYSDTECPFCKRFHTTLQQVMDQYDGKVKWAYKHFPLKTLHKKANKEANAVACAGEQGKFWEYLNTVFEETPSNDGLEDAMLYTFADNLKLDRTQFDECVSSGKYQSQIDAETAEGVSLGGTGTPYTVLIDKDGKVLDVISGAQTITSVTATLDKYVK